MSFDSHLIHTCTIEPAASGAVNVYNNPAKAYGTPVTGVRCRLVEAREKIWSDEIQESIVQTVYMLLVNRTTVISEKSRISLVTLEDGSTISDVFVVTELIVHRSRTAHHKTAMLERIS